MHLSASLYFCLSICLCMCRESINICVYVFVHLFVPLCVSVLCVSFISLSLSLSLSAVPPPYVALSQELYVILYAGTNTTFTCTVTLTSYMSYDEQNLHISWTGHENFGVYTFSETEQISNGTYISNLTFSPLAYRIYYNRIQCTARVSGDNFVPATNSDYFNLRTCK